MPLLQRFSNLPISQSDDLVCSWKTTSNSYTLIFCCAYLEETFTAVFGFENLRRKTK
jgi:hypothetical protein